MTLFPDRLVRMKTIQITFDEELLDRLDRDPAVRERSRSAVVREVVAVYLDRKTSEEIVHRYQVGYGDGSVHEELGGWAAGGVWPEG